MELWRQLGEAGLGLGLGPPPWALRGDPPAGRPGQTHVSPGADPRGARENLLWIWEELGHLRRLDDQLLSQLCSLGLALRALREDLAAFQEEEEEEEESSEEAEEEAPPGNQERGASRASCPAPPSRPPDFEMTI
ncbi:glutamate-rich protein 4 isoform X1 [Dasypus novemcinctus]|uniref:glutamate-rich protein 4 isoform X1 n=1 Tax=Dasypus novemcinctus TaxID=9361 RepID=UPI0003289E73|nr:glutamate-rich protein 4 isoform X1 [Dasypus novemcinctus]